MPHGKTCTRCGLAECDCCQDCIDLGFPCLACQADRYDTEPEDDDNED